MKDKNKKDCSVATTTEQPMSESSLINRKSIITEKSPKLNTILEVYSGQEIMEMDFPKNNFLIDNLVGKGLYILAGAPKVGKSWLALDWIYKISVGETIWNNKVNAGRTLYLCLEDNYRRIYDRLLYITEGFNNNFYFCNSVSKIGTGLEKEIEDFVTKCPETVLIIIDTFQLIRKAGSDISYANDYSELSVLKKLADQYSITILLIHHFRKDDSDNKFNKISGTTGIQGATDGMLILDSKAEEKDKATLHVTGRDVIDRTLKLKRNNRNIWELVSDSLENHAHPLVELIVGIMKNKDRIEITPTEFVERYKDKCDFPFSERTIRKRIEALKSDLLDYKIEYVNHRTGEKNLIILTKQDDDNDNKVPL